MIDEFSAKASRVLLLSCTALSLSGLGAAAQTMNYGSLEQMFGEPVTTSATGKPQTVSDAPANMIIITAEDIRRSGATSVADLPSRVLKNYPGIDVQQASLGTANVGIDGYDQPYSPKLLVLVNGRQVYLDDYGYAEWATIPVELAEIRQIEVVKGPASALFGFNAANGVINIVTFSPLYDNVREVSATAGSGNYYGGSAVVTGHASDRLGVRLSTGGYRSDEFDGWKRSGSAYDTRPDRTSMNADALARIGNATHVGLELSRTLSGQTDIATATGGSDARYRTWSAKGSLTSETPIGVISGQVYHNAAQTTIEGNVDGAQLAASGNVVAHFDNSVTVAQLSDLYQINTSHTLREAVEFRHNELSSEVTNQGTVSYDVFADSLMWDWQISPTLSWTNAGRIDHLDLSRSGPLPAGIDRTNGYYNHSLDAYSYNSGLVDKITDKDTVRLAVGQAIQAPSLLEYGVLQQLSLGPKTGILAGDVSVKPSIVKKYELGYARSMPEYGLTWSNSLFYQKTEDMMGLGAAYLQSGQTIVALSGNTGNSSERGLETGLAYKAQSGLKLDANYTFADIIEHADVTGEALDKKGTPRHKVNLHAGYTIDRFELDGYGHYVSRIYQQDLSGPTAGMVAIPGYFEFDARVGYRLTESVTAALSGTSIDLAHHQEDSGPAVDRRVLGTISVKF